MFWLLLVLSCCVSLFAERSWQPIPLDAPGYEWMDAQIEKEFFRFQAGITRAMVDATYEKMKKPFPDCRRYRIVSSKVYGSEGPMKNLLEAIASCYSMPDLDFIYYAHDVLREEAFKEVPENAPIFVSAKSRFCDRVVLFVDWYYDINQEEKGWNRLIADINAGQERWPWEKKKNVLFWRGANTDARYTEENWMKHPRGRLVYLSHISNGQLIDAAFHQINPECSSKSFQKNAVTRPFVLAVDHLPYKYQLLVDGATCTYPGTQWRLLSGCATFKQKSDDIMWFYSLLAPWVHYIPLKRDLSDVFDKILWAQKHDAEVRQIAQNARHLALNHLLPEHIVLYCAKTLIKYASLQHFTPCK